MSSLWQCLEALAGGNHVAAEWAKLSGEQFAPLRSAFLRDTQNRARFIPCPHGCGCEHEIVQRAGGKLAAVCRCEPWNCDDLPVAPAEVSLLALNTAKLGRALCKAFECDARETKLPLPLTWQIGAKFSNGVPVLLTIQNGCEPFGRVVAELTARHRQPFILLTPTSRHCNAKSRELLTTARAECFDLESNLTIFGNGSLHTKTSPGLLFQNFAPAAATGASDDDARRLFALLKALETESNYRKAPVTRVFQLYCLEEQSRNEVAKACHCVPSLITLRLKAIEKKLGRKPKELRVLSSQFERIADSLTDSRARHIDREQAIHGDDPPDED
jgi:hypothetical protein